MQKSIRNRLGWLDAPDRFAAETDDLTAWAGGVFQNRFTRALLLGMGGSSLCPEVLATTPHVLTGPMLALTVLDSTDPAVIRAAADAHPPGETLIIVSTKSGTTAETVSLETFFWERFRDRLGDEAGAHFVAITDPGNPLESRAKARGYRRGFLNPADIGGRYSALSYFGLVPAALMGYDLPGLLSRAQDMARRCRVPVGTDPRGPQAIQVGPPSENPGAELGMALAEHAKAGRDKLTFFAADALQAFPLWVEQLVAESLGKHGEGVVPIMGEPIIVTGSRHGTDLETRGISVMLQNPPSAGLGYGGDRVFVILQDESAPDPVLYDLATALSEAGHPVLTFALRDPAELWAEFFRWEFAVAVAGAIVGVNPFDEPDVDSAKARARDALRSLSTKTGQEASSQGAAVPLPTFLSWIKPGDYIAMLSYLPSTPGVRDGLEMLRETILARTGAAVTLGQGPRYLHSTGQMHKGGPTSGAFLLLTCDVAGELSIPGEAFTFGQLFRAQAMGDRAALEAAGRRVVHLHLARPVESALEDLCANISAS